MSLTFKAPREQRKSSPMTLESNPGWLPWLVISPGRYVRYVISPLTKGDLLIIYDLLLTKLDAPPSRELKNPICD